MLTSQGYTGVDVCDLAECSCKDPPAAACLATPATGSHSGAKDQGDAAQPLRQGGLHVRLLLQQAPHPQVRGRHAPK